MSDGVHSILFDLKKARIMLSNLPPQIQYCVYCMRVLVRIDKHRSINSMECV